MNACPSSGQGQALALVPLGGVPMALLFGLLMSLGYSQQIFFGGIVLEVFCIVAIICLSKELCEASPETFAPGNEMSDVSGSFDRNMMMRISIAANAPFSGTVAAAEWHRAKETMEAR